MVKMMSHMALDWMPWGTLGEVTNVPSSPKLNEKGRTEGRRGVRPRWMKTRNRVLRAEGLQGEGQEERQRSCRMWVTPLECRIAVLNNCLAPEPVDQPTDACARFNSLNSRSAHASHSCRASKSAVEHLRALTARCCSRGNSLCLFHCPHWWLRWTQKSRRLHFLSVHTPPSSSLDR